MNKFVKGSIAAGSGMVLLLGGAGSLAYWNSEAELAGGTIEAGSLELTAAEGVWTDELTHWVPGDEETFSTTLTLTTAGDNIRGTIELADESIVFSSADAFEVVVSLGADFVSPTGAELEFDAATEIFTFAGPGIYEIPVEVSVALPFSEESEQNASQHQSVNLDGLSFVATQTAAGATI